MSLSSQRKYDPPERDELYDLLSNHRRRYVLHFCKRADGPVTLSELAEQVAAWEQDKEVAELTAAERKRVYTSLQQTHLDRLADAGIVALEGDEVLEWIRERGLGCGVAMITAVDPDFDILELGFDAYLTKPVAASDLAEVTERLIRRLEYTDTLQEFFAKLSTRETLAAEKPAFELEADDRYRELEAEIEELREASEAHMSELDGDDFEALFYRLDGPEPF